jgi:hypothetical protein
MQVPRAALWVTEQRPHALALVVQMSLRANNKMLSETCSKLRVNNMG